MTPKERAQQIEEDLKMADGKRRADAEKESEMEDKKKADADEMRGNIDKLLKCMDALNSRFDAMETSMADKAKRDSEIEEKGDPREMSVDSDGNSDYPSSAGIRAGQPGKITAADSRADSIEHSNALAQCQVMADRADSAWSKSSPHPWTGEGVDAYMRRLAKPHKSHSENWRDVDLSELRGQALKNAASEIFKDSIEASCNPVQIGAVVCMKFAAAILTAAI
jgi:hypothetical protein